MLRILGLLTIFVVVLSAFLVYHFQFFKDILLQTETSVDSETYWASDDKGNLWVIDGRLGYIFKS